MAIFKCKICGGTIEFNQGESVGVCDSCGTKQTLPRLDDDKKENLYDRAGHFRRNNEFDKALSIYEQILNEDNTDAEAYWSIVLCRYGIEYVEDPVTHQRIPTVNRAQYTSIFADEDYKSAIQYADNAQRYLYKQEAEKIDEIQKGILEISAKEEPFDVFICYKETDKNGKRTKDSVLANDLYHQLTEEGFKVFFARITLEDKLGSAYEPYIFAALNSAKVMVVLGISPENFNAVWVKNEWSRYLALIKNGAKKMLIPAYRDMDAYDLPEEFSHLQAQDMSKLGFVQDLVRGIKKIVGANSTKNSTEKVPVDSRKQEIESLLKRATMFLEDEDSDKVTEYCDRILDLDPECAQAYLIRLMDTVNSLPDDDHAFHSVKRLEDLSNLEYPFEDFSDYQKVIRFGNSELSEKLKETSEQIKERIYRKAVDLMEEKKYADAKEKFKSIANYHYSNSEDLITECERREEERRAAEEEKEALNRRARILKQKRKAEEIKKEKIRKLSEITKIFLIFVAAIIACIVLTIILRNAPR